MKKLLTMGVAMTLSLGALMGCSNDANDSANDASETNNVADAGTNENETKEPVDLTLWLDNEHYANALIDALAVALPHINITFEEVGAVDALSKLELDGPAGLGADIMLLPHDTVANGMNQNLLLPLGAELGEMLEERILESALGTVKRDGSYFGAPLSTESIALFYNRTLLEEYELNVATTFEEIFEQAEVFNNASANEFILRLDPGNAYDSHFFLTAFGFELFGSNHDDGDAVNFNTPEVVEGLTFFQSVRDILDVPNGDLDWDSRVGAFIEGEVPYVITGPWSISDIREDGDFEWGVVKIPTINGVQPITFSGSTVASISAFTENADAARDVLAFMASDEGMQILYDVRGSIPALKDTSAIVGLSDDEQMLGILAQAEYSQLMPVIPEMSFFWDPAAAMFEAVWEGLLTPAEAAERAEEAFDSALMLSQQ